MFNSPSPPKIEPAPPPTVPQKVEKDTQAKQAQLDARRRKRKGSSSLRVDTPRQSASVSATGGTGLSIPA